MSQYYYPPHPAQGGVPQPPPLDKRSRWFTSRPAVGIGGLLLGIVMGNSGSSAPAETVSATAPAATVTATEPGSSATSTVTVTAQASAPAAKTVTAGAPAARVPGDGTFLVGDDIQPGTYRSSDNAEGCYWARLKDTTGGSGSINANEYGRGSAVVTITAKDAAFETSGCSEWVKIK